MIKVLLFLAATVFANPYPDQNKVPKDMPWQPTPLNALISHPPRENLTEDLLNNGSLFQGSPVLRIEISWNEDETYSLHSIVEEQSGTDNLIRASQTKDLLGSYGGKLLRDGKVIGYQTIGTGKEYRRLTRSLTFRYPKPDSPFEFVLTAENPTTGKMEEVLKLNLDPSQATQVPSIPVEVRTLKQSTGERKFFFNIYGDYFGENEKEKFFQAAQKSVESLQVENFPGFDSFEFRAVFSPSNIGALGAAQDLGMPIPERDTFLGFYFPYWDNFGRWYHVVYPTRESRYRNGLAQAAYDFALVLVNDGQYWGVGNFRELVTIPAYNTNFTYLLIHEAGHYFGLNEEYSIGGRTELEFAPEIVEPWSQNITFLKSPLNLKWQKFVLPTTKIPTPESQRPNYGAYPGGYAQSPPLRHSHIPNSGCAMASFGKFCSVCVDAINQRLTYEAGITGN